MLKKTLLFLAVLLAGVVPARADVRVSMHDGLVTIVAKDATVRQILAEWARVGRATIVNGDRVAGGPISIELTDVPEKQALDILLRSISGYIAAPRATVQPDASRFDRILLTPTTVQPRTASTSSAPPQLPQPRPFQLQPAPMELDGPNQAEAPRPGNQFAPPNQAPTGVPSAPPAGFGAPSQPPAAFGAPVPTAAPGGPIGTSAPGMILQPPTQPGQPGQPPPGRF